MNIPPALAAWSALNSGSLVIQSAADPARLSIVWRPRAGVELVMDWDDIPGRSTPAGITRALAKALIDREAAASDAAYEAIETAQDHWRACLAAEHAACDIAAPILRAKP